MPRKQKSQTYRLPDGSFVRQMGTLKIVIGPDGHGRVYGTDKDRKALAEAMANGALNDPAGAFRGMLRGTGKL